VESMDGTRAALPEPGIVLARASSAGQVSGSGSGESNSRMSISRVSWHGWSDCFLIENGVVEAIAVPAIGRVMHFGLAGQKAGCFWQNRALDGQMHQKASSEWSNFGGDKCWPAPQSAWPRLQGRGWPPPAAFDSLPMQANAASGSIGLTSPLDPALGIQLVRHVELEPGKPVMRIRSEFRKLFGSPVQTSVWSIAQLREPERVSMLLSPKSRFPDGYVRLMKGEPASLKIDGQVLLLSRHPRDQVKIGADAASLACVGPDYVIRIDAQSGPGEYPDGGCLTEVYTSPDPLQYVELETLGPLTTIGTGVQIDRTTVYTIRPRSTPDAVAEALSAF